MDKVSIIVPIYKVPKAYLKKCVNSILNQSYRNIEILLVDDGSPDDCGTICDKYAKKDNRIKVIHQVNKGLCGARNTGIIEATGKWIMFIDGDDWIENNTIEYLSNYFSDSTSIICCGYVKDYGYKIIENNYSKYFVHGKKYNSEKDILFLKNMCLNFKSYISSSCGKVIKRKILIDNNIMFDENLKQGAEGIDFCYRLFDKSKETIILNKYFYHYVFNDNSITTIPDESNTIMTLNCFKKIYSYLDSELRYVFFERILYFIITTAISVYFNPKLKMPFKRRIEKFNQFANDFIISNSLEYYKNFNIDLDKKRKIILYIIINKKFYFLYILSFYKNIILKGKK